MEIKQDQKKTLMQIAAEVSQEISLLTDADREDLDIEVMFDSLACEFSEKLDRCVYASDLLLHQASWYKAQAEKLSKMAKTLEKRSDWLKENIKNSLWELDLKTYKTDFNKFTVSETKGALKVVDESMIPREYLAQITEWVPDKDRIKEAIEAGFLIPGCELKKSISLRISSGASK